MRHSCRKLQLGISMPSCPSNTGVPTMPQSTTPKALNCEVYCSRLMLGWLPTDHASLKKDETCSILAARAFSRSELCIGTGGLAYSESTRLTTVFVGRLSIFFTLSTTRAIINSGLRPSSSRYAQAHRASANGRRSATSLAMSVAIRLRSTSSRNLTMAKAQAMPERTSALNEPMPLCTWADNEVMNSWCFNDNAPNAQAMWDNCGGWNFSIRFATCPPISTMSCLC
mmetsp:Transcript_5932/g.11428  ORF Transcript_5932/g.11428 Transcript_5932/m.11428 type:complete len:227 (+) Transcript_5932:2025-2705(+)